MSRSENSSSHVWRALGDSQQGESHRRSGLVNQDAILSELGEPDATFDLLAVVADGHGSAKSFRSNVGSQIAVSTCQEELRSFANRITSGQPHSVTKDDATRHLPNIIVRRWREQVREHLTANPITDAEWQALENDQGKLVRERLENEVIGKGTDWHVIYGSTLLSVLVTDTFILYLQLGDGEILEIPHGAESPRSPIQENDPTLIANETTSLCLADAQQKFRSQFVVLGQSPPPQLILLTTDGYPNSFQSRAGFEQVATDLLAMLRDEGQEIVAQGLPDWLREASTQGSGDDISVVLAFRETPVATATDEPPVVTDTPESETSSPPSKSSVVGRLLLCLWCFSCLFGKK